LTLANNELETEKSLRTRFERDAAWKDISFTAAHKMGNPIFAIETSLDPLRKRIVEQRTSEAVQVLDRVRASVEKAKELVDDFKSLSKAQEIKPVPVKLRPLIEEACGMAKEHDVKCRITIPDDLCVIGDPIRLGECFDEIISNAVHWHSKGLTSIRVKAQQANSKSLPDSLEVSARYVTVIIQDNGPGVVTKNKSRIFDAFFTTRDQGTGLGLALVRRIIEGHGGTIVEDGIPDKGARFVLHIPLAMSTSGIALTARSERRPKRAKGK
jgi:signal transduction histidine kinase